MLRIVVDPNVLVSAAISAAGPPRQVVVAWVDERFELIVSPVLLDELRDVLGRPKFRRFISLAVAREFVDGLADDAQVVEDPTEREAISRDPDDDYLIALARAAGADYLVSGDGDLLDLENPDPPVLTPRQFLDALDA